ncbi:MAG: nucleotidyltransferase domain-containing protein [Bacteroidales bacterium]|jgi:hypothetical protein
MDRIISANIENIKTICDTYNIKSLYAFGSVCTDKFNKNSDIDLLVSFKPMNYGDYADNYFMVCEIFEKLFKRKVDLITDKSLSNPYFINSINKTKTILYE